MVVLLKIFSIYFFEVAFRGLLCCCVLLTGSDEVASKTAKPGLTAAATDIWNMQKGTAVAFSFVVYSVVQRLVIRHSPKIRFQISIEHQIRIRNRVIVD